MQVIFKDPGRTWNNLLSKEPVYVSNVGSNEHPNAHEVRLSRGAGDKGYISLQPQDAEALARMLWDAGRLARRWSKDTLSGG